MIYIYIISEPIQLSNQQLVTTLPREKEASLPQKETQPIKKVKTCHVTIYFRLNFKKTSHLNLNNLKIIFSQS